MNWVTFRRTLDWARSLRPPPERIVVSGGEPLLVLSTLKRAVLYWESVGLGGTTTQWVLQTNGTLIDRTTLEFLATARFAIDLSFDGIAAAQEFRERETFAHLDGVLDWISRGDSGLPPGNLTVLMTVHSATIGAMADSFAYLLGKQVANISISPAHGRAGLGASDPTREMEQAFDHVGELSLRHFATTGTVPFIPFRTDCGLPPLPWESRTMCGVLRGDTPAVDVDGSVYGCAMLVQGAAARARPWLQAEIDGLRIGKIADPGLDAGFDAFVANAWRSPFLTNKQDKSSASARCAICPAISECDLCPVSIGLIPGNDDPNRVPDFACAFHLAGFRAKQRFRASIRASMLAPRPAG
jgi:sulfatase maturation enzyme AslB (radical SAM superfamily)